MFRGEIELEVIVVGRDEAGVIEKWRIKLVWVLNLHESIKYNLYKKNKYKEVINNLRYIALQAIPSVMKK